MVSDAAQEIVCQQVLMEDASVYSCQWMTLPSSVSGTMSPRFLLDRYLSYIRTWSLGLIRPTQTGDGLEFRLLGTRLSLISFTGPDAQEAVGETSLMLRICGGVLVQREECGRGELSFAMEHAADGVTLALRLADYCPLLLGSRRPSWLRKMLYRFTQAFIHRMVTVNFLADCYRELAGRGACVRVVRLSRHGLEEI